MLCLCQISESSIVDSRALPTVTRMDTPPEDWALLKRCRGGDGGRIRGMMVGGMVGRMVGGTVGGMAGGMVSLATRQTPR